MHSFPASARWRSANTRDLGSVVLPCLAPKHEAYRTRSAPSTQHLAPSTQHPPENPAHRVELLPMAAPRRVRGRVLAFAFLLTIVTYLDRICISAAAPDIRRDLHLTALQMGEVFSAFTLA